MALAINIEGLLNKQKIESNRIKFFAGQSGKAERKKGWNQASIYNSLCAFTIDYEFLVDRFFLRN